MKIMAKNFQDFFRVLFVQNHANRMNPINPLNFIHLFQAQTDRATCPK